MPITEKYTSEPPPVPAGIDLRVYSNPICAFAQVMLYQSMMVIRYGLL